MDLIEKVDKLKIKIDIHQPFESSLLNQIKEFYRVRMAYSSIMLEKKTITEAMARAIIEYGQNRSNFSAEVKGYNKAYDYMFSLLEKKSVTEENILEFHRLIYSEIDEERAGKYRTEPIVNTKSHVRASKIKNIPADIQALCEWAEDERENEYPVLFAAELCLRLIFIHPFAEGNAHVARLLMNTALMQEGYLPCFIPAAVRHEYIGFMDLAYKNEKPFKEFILKREEEVEKDFIRILQR